MPLSLTLIAAGFLLLALAAWLLDWKPTPDWPLFWRKWSTWLAGLNAALWAHVTASTGLLLGFIPFVSSDYRGFAAGAVFVVGLLLPVVAAHIRQSKLEREREYLEAHQRIEKMKAAEKQQELDRAANP